MEKKKVIGIDNLSCFKTSLETGFREDITGKTVDLNDFRLVNQKIEDKIPSVKRYICKTNAGAVHIKNHPYDGDYGFALDVELVKYESDNSYVVRQTYTDEGNTQKVRVYDTVDNDGWGDWSEPFVKYGIMKGASSMNSGSSGLVPQPYLGDNNRFLRGDGTWAAPSTGLQLVSNSFVVPGIETLNADLSFKVTFLYAEEWLIKTRIEALTDICNPDLNKESYFSCDFDEQLPFGNYYYSASQGSTKIICEGNGWGCTIKVTFPNTSDESFIYIDKGQVLDL